jgi:nicotinamide riboside transporter PnuC
MMVKKNDILFWLGIITAIWFAVTGMVWTYWAALVVAYPAGIVSLFAWTRIKNENKCRTKFIPLVLWLELGFLFQHWYTC